jgi:hypothetical protein
MNFYGVPWWNWSLQILGLTTSYYGAVRNAKMDIKGFYIWLISNIILFLLHLFTGLWVLCLLDILYFRINLIGIKNWKNKNL